MKTSKLHYSDRLAAIEWPPEAIFIVDSALPQAVIADLDGPIIEVEAGEDLKTLRRVEALAQQVLNLRSTRPMTIVAVGGGSIGDAIGFLASILWRGVELWHVPTTLLAMVDSAHGGKTAVNLGGRKNQLGTFYPAEVVVLCREILDTLPLDLREEGLAELVKALWLGGDPTLSRLDDIDDYQTLLTAPATSHPALWEEMLSASVAIKQQVVARDPYEQSGLRRILNLGHTAGHGLEALFGLPHGRAVAWGMAACAMLSEARAGLTRDERDRFLAHLAPLLVPLPEFVGAHEKDHFQALLRRDKKQEDGKLISILLDAPGEPVQRRDITPADWWNAVWQAHRSWRSAPIEISLPVPLRGEPIALPPDKSRANRAQIIAHLRPGLTQLDLGIATPAADILELRRALQRLGSFSPEQSVEILAGNGGTTGRFLIALAATRPGETTIHLGPTLARRPHTPLIDAMRRAGAAVELFDTGLTIQGWSTFPDKLVVDASTSSQFASAIALLAATGEPFDLLLEGPVVSRPYLEITLAMLREAGVHVDDEGERITFSASPSLVQDLDLVIPADTSAAVVWEALAALDGRPDSFLPAGVEHPDRRIRQAIDELSRGGSHPISIDLGEAPDLAPVLTALAALRPEGMTIVGAEHLRHKESNRIDGLATSLEAVGIAVTPTADGLEVAPGRQRPASGSRFDTRQDHRLAMAALVLAHGNTTLIVDGARCVHKSYPDFWRQARRAGARLIIDTSDRWPDT